MATEDLAIKLATYDPVNQAGIGYQNPGYTNPPIDNLNVSMSDFTLRVPYENLISRITNNITSNDASIRVRNTVFNLTGKTFTRQKSEFNYSNPTINALQGFLDNKNSKIQGVVNGFVKTPYTNFSKNLLESLDINRPNVTINLSSEGFLSKAPPIDLKKYVPMTNVVKDSWKKMGESIDEVIKNNFFVQLFNLKATDILCSGICIIFALLPCKTANEIIDTIHTIQEYQAMAKSSVSTLNGFNNYVSDSFNNSFGNNGPIAGLANLSSFKTTMNQAFNGLRSYEATIKNDPMVALNLAISTASLIVKTLNLLVSMVRISQMDYKKLWGWVVGGMYDLLNNVLMALQAMAVQLADSIFNKLIAPLEKMFKDLVPDNCGTLAKIFFAKILATIYGFKNKLIQFVADLFSFMKVEHTKFSLFTNDAPWVLQLSAYLKLFNLLIDNFLDIAIGCGITKRTCPGDNPLWTPQTSLPYTGSDFAYPTVVAKDAAENLTAFKPIKEYITSDDLDIISEKLKDQIKMIYPTKDISIGPNRTTIKELDNIPPLIKDILNNTSLGPGVTIYQDPLANMAKLVYENPALCGA